MPAHVLLIEDAAYLRTAIVAYLVRHRHRVTACESIAEASDALAHLPAAVAPDAIMSGIYLADGNGLSFYLKVSGQFPNMRWILTATDAESCDANASVGERRAQGGGHQAH